MDCHEMLYRHSWSTEDESYWRWWLSDWMKSHFQFWVRSGQPSRGLPRNLVQIFKVPRGWILMLMLMPLTTFPLVPPAGQSFLLSSEMFRCSRWIGTNFCKDIHGSQRMSPNDFNDPFFFSSRFKCLNDYWIVIKKSHPSRMNCNNFGDPLTFHLTPIKLTVQYFEIMTKCLISHDFLKWKMSPCTSTRWC